jgi:2',3'-cyclic-nucleotide 2'-phosphodiesterase (5'-nucleotidase family)
VRLSSNFIILRLWFLFFISLIFVGCTSETEQPQIKGTTLRLTVLRTTDIHSRVFPYDLKPNSHDEGDGLFSQTAPYGGLERIGALIARERQRGQRVVYMDSGDIFQGAPIFNFGNGEPEFRWLTTVKSDAVVVGNHEFDAGADNLAKQAEDWINYPFLTANYIFSNWLNEANNQLGRFTQPFSILNIKGLKIGVIGMGDIGSMYSITQGGNSSGITPMEANETVRSYIELINPAVDLIVVLSHLGLTEDKELTDGHEIFLTEDKDVSHYLKRENDPWIAMECDECQGHVRKYWVPGVRGIDIILGGHLHILTNPPMILTDPSNRKVVLEHAGAFAKFMTRLDFAIAVPHDHYYCDTDQNLCAPQDNHFSNGKSCTSDEDCTKIAQWGAEVVAHQHKLFPIDTIWCTEVRPDPYSYPFGDTTGFQEDLDELADFCKNKGHSPSRNLLEPYRTKMELDPRFILTQMFGYAPKSVLRKNTGTGGDSALGNITTLAMMIRKRVEAEFCVTNTLGIRDNFYPGVIDMETVFNVFPFENTITVMYLSGAEIQEMFDFIAERSHGRGCQSQAQISGATFTMNCGQVKRNDEHYPCETAEDCCQYRPEICEPDYEGTAQWECLEGACYSHPGEDIKINGKPLNKNASYKMATNDYIANGGSGFNVLRRNTTKIDTGIAMRDALVEYLLNFPTCEKLLASDPNQVDPFSLSFCLEHGNYESQRNILVKGACTCGDVRDGNTNRCPSLNPVVEQFCSNPLAYPIIVAESDNRIVRKVN